MSFKKSVLLLLTVFALISFANQREAAVEAAESLGYIDFSEITQEGAEIALGLVEEFIQDKELDLIPGDVESLYGYGYGDKQIAYMILCHPEGKVRNMSEYQGLLHTKYQLFKERDYYVNLAREQELEYSNALVPEENRSANSEVNKLISGMYLVIVAKVEGQYHLIQSSNIFNLQITHYQRDVFEAYGEPVDYYLTNNYLDYTEYGGDIEYLSFFSVFPIFRDDEGNITRPMEIENPNQGKPKYQHDKMYIQPDEFY